MAVLASAYRITKDERYAAKAVQFLDAFFLDALTRMNPHLLYAQAIPGVSSGRKVMPAGQTSSLRIEPSVKNRVYKTDMERIK